MMAWQNLKTPSLHRFFLGFLQHPFADAPVEQFKMRIAVTEGLAMAANGV